MLKLQLDWDRPAKNYSEISSHVLRVSMIPVGKILPLKIAIALDTSSSMEGEKLAQAKKACQEVVKHLRDVDRLYLAGFADKVTPLIENLPGDSTAVPAAQTAIANLQAQSITRTDLALKWIRESLPPENGVARVGILITDGHPTNSQGRPLNQDQLDKLIINTKQYLQGQNIVLHTIGLGNPDYFNDKFLSALSNASLGTFLFADTPEKLQPQVQEKLTISQKIALSETTIHLDLQPGVELTGFCRIRPEYCPLEETLPRQLSLGLISKDEPTDLLIQLQTPAGQFGGNTGLKNIITIAVNSPELETPVRATVAIKYTNSYTEAQVLQKEVDNDRLSWQAKILLQELKSTDDPWRKTITLGKIRTIAAQLDDTILGEKTSQGLQEIQTFGGISQQTSLGLFTHSRNFGQDPIPGMQRFLTRENAQLKLLNGPKPGQIFPLDQFQLSIRIGRESQDTGIPVNIDLSEYDLNNSVSRNHCELIWVNEKLEIRDLDSTNGTIVNGKKLVKEESICLTVNNIIQLGSLEMQVIINE